MSPLLRRFLPAVVLTLGLAGCAPRSAAPGALGPGGQCLFCFWNAENFFDNRRDGERNEPDRMFDEWFADDPAVFEEKLDHLTRVLARMNDGRGPDILPLAEVENENAAELLKESLNWATRGAPPYETALWLNPHGGRHIANAILTRLPVRADATHLHGHRQRILEAHIEANGHDLVVIASHWTSRVSDEAGRDEPGKGRRHYAEVIYRRFRQLYEANPAVDVLICGDFNDNPDDVSVTQDLHATGNLRKVRAGGEPPLLYDVFRPLWDEHTSHGTHYYHGRPYIFDQIVVSPGMLDEKGWTCEVDTAHIDNKHPYVDAKGRPDPFGTRREKGRRGASDHLPVTVKLRVAGG